MKNLFVTLLIASTLGVVTLSCEKEKDFFPGQSEMTSITPPPDQGGDTTIDQTKASWILNATSANQIPSTYFTSHSKYKGIYYKHIHQPDGTSCSWTSYILCASSIVNGDWQATFYPVTSSKIYAFKNQCNGNSNIDTLKKYALKMDDIFFSSIYRLKESKNSTGRFNAIKQMLNHLYTYQKPFIAIITLNGIGHYVVVWDINWKVGGTGSIVYYTDPHDNPTGSWSTQKKSMNFTEFLDKMGPLNSYTNYYGALMPRY